MVKKIGILGFGREGKAMLSYLKKQKSDADIWILDKKKQASQGFYDKKYLKHLKDFDLIYRSPGILYSNPEVQKAIKAGVEFSSGTEVFFKEIEKTEAKIIGITGTKGKGTTATLLHNILKASKYKVELVGNIGVPALDLLEKCKKADYIIFELSSFQLQDLRISPDISVVLGIFPDHLDAHQDFPEYVDAKTSIAKYQKTADKIFYVPDNKYTSSIVKKSQGEKIKIDLNSFPNLEMRILGKHNFLNAIVAATVTKNIGCEDEVIQKTIKNFKGLKYRLELTKKIRNVLFYNDSTGTNPESAAAGILSFKKPIILLAGGKDKGFNYIPLAKAIEKSTVQKVILYGENKNKIKRFIKPTGVNIEIVDTLYQATKLAYSDARKNQVKTIVLLSPASASFDQFEDIYDRGRTFSKIVSTLQKSK